MKLDIYAGYAADNKDCDSNGDGRDIYGGYVHFRVLNQMMFMQDKAQTGILVVKHIKKDLEVIKSSKHIKLANLFI